MRRLLLNCLALLPLVWLVATWEYRHNPRYNEIAGKTSDQMSWIESSIYNIPFALFVWLGLTVFLMVVFLICAQRQE